MDITVLFDISEYRNAHGKNPSGLGFWFFKIYGKEFSFYGKYSETKKLARKEALKYNINPIIVYVLS